MEKIESGKIDISPQPIEIMPLVEQTLEANSSYGEQLRVRFALSQALPGVMVLADNGRLMQVLTNLLSNAAKFSPADDVVSVSVKRSGESVRVAVSDHGPGIPEEFRGRIFEKFSQADSSDARQKGGSGLGLSISKALIERMGGSIGFESQPGKGATFYVDIPEWQEQRTAEHRRKRDPRRPRVLICENDHAMAGYLSALLDEGGFSSDIALDAVHAKWLLNNGHYVAMTLDSILPDQSGLSLARELYLKKHTHSLPIVVVSDCADQARESLGGDMHSVVDWLGKPVDGNRLLAAVRRIVQQNQLPRILHIEDNQDTASMVRELLSDLADVTVSVDMEDAKFRLARETFDLVILDLLLPDGFGTDILTHIKDVRSRPVPVVIYSVYPVSEEMARRVAAAFVKSETSPDQLRETICLFLDSACLVDIKV
ncbi:MAG: ATP-binding protein, partial [Gammaproteobacteria bacterium]|nr:ATP-binding protein [Gammaproteobacteria bacterium]